LNRVVRTLAIAAIPLAGAAMLAAGPQEGNRAPLEKGRVDLGMITWSSGDLKMTAAEFKALPQRVVYQVISGDSLAKSKGWNPKWKVGQALEITADVYGRSGIGEATYYTGQGRLIVYGEIPEAEAPAASKLLIAALNEHLQRMYEELSVKDLRNMQMAQRDLKRTEDELQAAWDREGKVRDEFVAKFQRPLPATDDALAAEQAKSANDILDAEFAILAAAKRRDALEANLKNNQELGQVAKQQIEKQLEARQRIVKLRRDELENMKQLHKSGAAPTGEVRKAEITVAEAESLLENEMLTARRSLEDQMAAARAALTQTREEAIAAEERLKHLKTRSTGSAEMQKLVRMQRRAKQHAEDLEQDARALWRQVRELERRANLADPPSIRRLGDPA